MLRWTERAVADLIAIGDYIAVDDPGAARTWVEKLRERALASSEFPLMGRVVPEVGRPDIRETFLRTYRIIYRIEGEGIVVLTVFEGHRLLGELNSDER